MNKINLYNQDGSLCSEAQFLLSSKPDDMSRGEWIKLVRKFKSSLSAEDLKEFKKLKKREIDTRWKVKNPEKVKASDKRRRVNNPEKAKATDKRSYAKNAEKRKIGSAKWRANNPEKVKQNNERHKAKNSKKATLKRPKKTKEEIAQKQREDSARWRAENPEKFKEQKRKERNTPHDKLRRIVYGAFKRIGQGKPTDTLALLGCTWEEAKAHMESLFLEGMTWENHGEWHIDHIRPVASFKGASEEELKQMNHISNLQPLWAIDNIKKGDKWDGELNSKILNFEV